jgi:hypothetical protein
LVCCTQKNLATLVILPMNSSHRLCPINRTFLLCSSTAALLKLSGKTSHIYVIDEITLANNLAWSAAKTDQSTTIRLLQQRGNKWKMSNVDRIGRTFSVWEKTLNLSNVPRTSFCTSFCQIFNNLGSISFSK